MADDPRDIVAGILNVVIWGSVWMGVALFATLVIVEVTR